MNISQAFKPLTPEPVTCSGYELASVLSGIRARGGFVSGLEAGIGRKNAMYRVSYFGNMAEESQSAQSRTLNAGQAGPAVPTNFVMRQDRRDATQTSTRHVSEGEQRLSPRGGDCLNRNVSTRVSTGADTTETPGSGLAHPAHDESIESRMARLQQRLRDDGKLRCSKPSTQPQRARCPHNDE